MTKRLSLQRERLTELTADDLAYVVAGSVDSAHPETCQIVSGLTRRFECEDLTHNC
jgi:hypothetical protein